MWTTFIMVILPMSSRVCPKCNGNVLTSYFKRQPGLSMVCWFIMVTPWIGGGSCTINRILGLIIQISWIFQWNAVQTKTNNYPGNKNCEWLSVGCAGDGSNRRGKWNENKEYSEQVVIYRKGNRSKWRVRCPGNCWSYQVTKLFFQAPGLVVIQKGRMIIVRLSRTRLYSGLYKIQDTMEWWSRNSNRHERSYRATSDIRRPHNVQDENWATHKIYRLK